jgi:catechol 2,3-dioxygenase-like lactoylglutathione lyase family enzyme
MPSVWVRYFVNDLDAAIAFYCERLGFALDLHPGPGFAALSLGPLQLLLSTPTGGGGAAQALTDGRRPEPGGWNRIQLRVEDLDTQVEQLRRVGAHFRSDVIAGNGGKQILLDDPCGNPIELFEPYRR